MNKLHTILNYLIYRLRSVNEHAIHSPFIFSLTKDVIYNKEAFYSYESIEHLRSQLIKSQELVKVLDLGAGSQKNNAQYRTISQIARNAAKPSKYAQLLFRLCDHFQPQTIIELGTSLGVSTAYLASANSKSWVHTIEGSPEIAQKAKQNFEQLGLKNIHQHTGNFDEVLPELLEQVPTPGLIFFDGNHRKEATLHYFELCLKKINNETIFIFDDIYWSKEMTEAWEEIKNHEAVTVTVDLFFIGIVFFRKEQKKQHFVIKF